MKKKKDLSNAQFLVNQIHKLIALNSALTYELDKVARLQDEIASIKLPKIRRRKSYDTKSTK